MPYSDFKTIENIKDKFKIPIISGGSLFYETDEIEAGHILTEILQENITLALNINTEKARSEMIISPVLVEVRKILNRKVSLFSGIEFNVDDTLGLNGYCDFIISNSSNQIFLESPIVCIVEAKNENIRTGYAQCIAEMIAAEIFNQRNSSEVCYILGAVTTGINWKFLKYESGKIFIDFDEYLINRINKILGIFAETVNNQQYIKCQKKE